LLRESFPSSAQLTSEALSKSAQHGIILFVSFSTQFMGKVSTYYRQCKENAENLHKTEESMETTVSPVKQVPPAAFTPNTQSQFHTTTTSPTPFTGKCIKPWHKGESSGRVNPSKRPRQSEAICGTKKSKKKLRRLRTQTHCHLAEVYIPHLTVVQKKTHSPAPNHLL